MKKIITIGVIAIASFGVYLGISKFHSAPVTTPTSDVVVGDTVPSANVSPFTKIGNMILPKSAVNDFGLGSTTATSSAPFAFDVGSQTLKLTNINVTGTCTGCSGSSGFVDPHVAFLTLTTTASLSLERALTGTSNQIVLTDNGAGSTLVLSLPQSIHTGATPTFAGLTLTGGLFGTSASLSTNFEVLGTASVSGRFFGNSTASNSFAGSLNISKGLTANSYQGGGLGVCSTSGKVIRYNGGQFSCGTLATGDIDYSAVFQPLDATLTALAGLDSTAGFVGITGADTFVRRTLTGTANQIGVTNGTSATGNPVFSITSPFIAPGNASVSSNFEVLGTASVSGKFTQGSVASNSFLGSLTGPTTGTLSVGTSDNPLKILWSNIVRIVSQLFFSGYTGTTVATNEANIHTASNSLDFNGNGTTKILDGIYCPTIQMDSPTATNPSYSALVDPQDPITFISAHMIASGSNSATWNLVYGSANSPTSVALGPKKASSSSQPTYTTFGQSTLTDGQVFGIRLASVSATLQKFQVQVCYRKNH